MDNHEKEAASSKAPIAQALAESSPGGLHGPAPDSNPSSPSATSPVPSSPSELHSPDPDTKPSSPARSSVSSDLSHVSSLSHGSSPAREKPPSSPPPGFPDPQPLPVVNGSVRNEPVTMTKVDPGVGSGFVGGGVAEGVGRRRVRLSLSILRREKRDSMVKKAALGFRLFALIFCLISLSLFAADTNKGWALDSFYRYKEFRYCMSVNVIGFVYSAAQVCDLVYHLSTGKYIVRNQLRFYLDFSVDQVLTYLLMSASSSAATRVEDWQSNWGKDKFPDMASISVGMSFVAFVALASSTLVSGYTLCTRRSL
ncbi:LOW QUALITY PROTEIN: CASP-like protein 4A3 [Diospyros lotus]|uniref:LOW QUALITY PROTEIN: CASP-like protein 4A3 n=1 Tax=Diospyros lotus TaxID=55363 RepID=UPI00225BFA26|nr:LOW QUALITY PROTEIN: CASP-like protein 4A3 [Diospyros lotus]